MVVRMREAAGRRADRPGLDYMIHVFSLMYPGSRIHVRRMPGVTRSHGWALVPNARNPSMLVPLAPGATARASLDELTKRGRPRLEKAARLASRVGGLHVLPRLIVNRSGDDVQSVLDAMLDDQVMFSMIVGRVRALQKPVLRIMNREGVTVAFAKIGVSEVTRALVRHEAQVLSGFAHDPPRHFSAPSLRGIREWGELVILAQAPMFGGDRPDDQAVRRAAVEIVERGSAATATLSESSWWHDLRARVAQLPASNPHADALSRVARRIARDCGGVLVRAGSWHGDFTEWNMCSDGMSLHIWDWEGCTGPVPAGFDLLHYRFQGDVVVRGIHPTVALRHLLDDSGDLLSPWKPSEPRLIVALYLLHLVTGLIETGDTDTRISRLGDWLPAALNDLEFPWRPA